MPELPHIEYTDGLRFTICPVCRETCVIPRLLFLQACAGERQIFCPNGHAYIPTDPDNKPSSNALQSNVELTAALHDSRRLAQSLAARLALAGRENQTVMSVSKKELKRRSKLLAIRIAPVEYGRRPCPVCGNKKQNEGALADHMMRQHPEYLAELESSAFDLLGANNHA